MSNLKQVLCTIVIGILCIGAINAQVEIANSDTFGHLCSSCSERKSITWGEAKISSEAIPLVRSLSGAQTNKISASLSSAKGSKDTGRIVSGKVTYTYSPNGKKNYGVRIDLVDFDGKWVSNQLIDNRDCTYEIELWKTGNWLAEKKQTKWVSLSSLGQYPRGGLGDVYVTCPDLKNFDTNFQITQSGNYFVQIKVVHNGKAGYNVFNTDWSKHEPVSIKI
jgi:hypothetical protein